MDTNLTPKFDHFYTAEDIIGKNGEPITEHKPRVTACYIKKDNHVAVGLAICSLDDNPSKRQGRAIALNRAVYALEQLVDSLHRGMPADITLLPINRERALDVMWDVNIDRRFPREYKAFVVLDTPNFRIGRWNKPAVAA